MNPSLRGLSVLALAALATAAAAATPEDDSPSKGLGFLEANKDYVIRFPEASNIFKTSRSEVTEATTTTADGQKKSAGPVTLNITVSVTVFQVVRPGGGSWVLLRHPTDPDDFLRWSAQRRALAILAGPHVEEMRAKTGRSGAAEEVARQPTPRSRPRRPGSTSTTRSRSPPCRPWRTIRSCRSSRSSSAGKIEWPRAASGAAVSPDLALPQTPHRRDAFSANMADAAARVRRAMASGGENLMTVFTFHLAETGIGTTIRSLCRPPTGQQVPGLNHAECMTRMTLGAPILSPARMQLRHLTMFAAWDSHAAIDEFLAGTRLGRALATGLACPDGAPAPLGSRHASSTGLPRASESKIPRRPWSR